MRDSLMEQTSSGWWRAERTQADWRAGQADSGTWAPLANITVPGNVNLGVWYHINLRVTGCAISATAQSTASWDQADVAVSDAGCPTSGSAGIRTMLATGDVTAFTVTKG